MSDVNDLIKTARRAHMMSVSDVGRGTIYSKLADALESEHAEVERLRGEVERLAADVVWNIERSNTWQERAERAGADQHEAERAGRVWRSRAEHDEFVNATLTAQLQAVRDAAETWMEEADVNHEEDNYDAGTVAVAQYILDILDAAADEPKRLLLTHPHDGHGPDDTCFECAADGGE